MEEITIELGRIGCYSYTKEDFLDSIFDAKAKTLDDFDRKIFERMSLEDRFFFTENRESRTYTDLVLIIKKYLSINLDFHTLILKDDVLFNAGCDPYEVLYHYDGILDNQIKKNKVIKSLLDLD